MNNSNLDLASIYGIPPCVNGVCAPRTSNTRIPTLEEIANYNLSNQPQIATTQSQNLQQPMNQTSQSNQPSATPLSPITPTTQPHAISSDSLQYMNGFIRTQIGRTVKVDFLIGTNTLVDKTGTLLGVGANYILINETETDDITVCDFYNIKFMKFYY